MHGTKQDMKNVYSEYNGSALDGEEMRRNDVIALLKAKLDEPGLSQRMKEIYTAKLMHSELRLQVIKECRLEWDKKWHKSA